MLITRYLLFFSSVLKLNKSWDNVLITYLYESFATFLKWEMKIKSKYIS